MPCDYQHYPAGWRELSRRIRFDRAGGRCEWCHAAHGQPHPITGSRVVLTVAHLGTPHADGRPGDKHDKHDCRPENLAALCQRCHLAFDHADHLAHAAATRERRRCQREPFLTGTANPCRALVHCPHGYEPTWHREMAALSGVLNRLRREAGLSLAAVDRLAVAACGRKWADFRSLDDYRAACQAVAAAPHR